MHRQDACAPSRDVADSKAMVQPRLDCKVRDKGMHESHDSLSELMKDIEVAEQQLEKGEGIPHEEAKRRLFETVKN